MKKRNSQFSFTYLILTFSLIFLNACAVKPETVAVVESTIANNISQHYVSHKLEDNKLVIITNRGKIQVTPLPSDSIEVFVLQDDVEQLPSFSKLETLQAVPTEIQETLTTISLLNGHLKAVVNKHNLSIDFYRGVEFLVHQSGYFSDTTRRGFNFKLNATEKILGGGQRILGMDRRGHRMPLYNRAHYGYETESNQMNFSLPMVMSSKKYSILFDNSAKGYLDIGKTEQNTLSFEAVAGRTAYIIFTAQNYPKLINNYVDITGKQPLPPRWAFGNFLSRFGYRTETEVLDTVKKTIKADFPVDAIILDLYWFGPDIKGHVGNLAWDKKAFPEHQKMLDTLNEQGIKPIIITEPFILSNSLKWQDAVDNKVLTKHLDGSPYTFDFYFGNTGLIDVFDEKAQSWFWDVYEDIFNQGVAGTWGDLGEPEVHPDDSLHYLSSTGQTVRADAIHNVYGHQWAKLVYENQLKLQPENRPFILMRSGFSGSQRYGMIPWTGDVSRSWGGLKPQVELSLQMSLFGMAYTHSDLGGFAGGEVFDKEMYIRWLEYGVFQPIYRPHAQDNIAPEPVFHDTETQDIIREYIKLRYRLLPYIYTLAYENSTTGMPLMRPVFFEDENNLSLMDIKDAYLWGDNFFISPITDAGLVSQSVKLPKGVWFDFWDDTQYQGDQLVDIPVNLRKIPVLVRAGAFIPMVDEVRTTRDYSSQKLTLHYYNDATVTVSKGYMYEDDGSSFNSIANKAYELINFSVEQSANSFRLELSREGEGYQGMPSVRAMKIVLHNWITKPTSVAFNDQQQSYEYDDRKKQLTILVNWDHQLSQLNIN
ncbi:MAG: glycosyl hydrolase [Gammaproteobacteria bacterium]|nr:MAG: glycosyl hydrolase [Gammaproteobacteria bacterium]